MSVGNLNTQGDKKNNWTWQNAVLQLLGQIAAGGGGGGCPCPSSAQEATLLQVLIKLTAVTTTPSLARVTNALGSPIVAGAKSVTVYNAGAANGLVLGSTIKPGESLTWSAGDMNNTLGAISYDGTGTELVITKVV